MAKDMIPGGLADNKSDKEFDKKRLRQGMKVESEHTSSKSIAKEITKDHLTEDKDYYKKLKKIEKKAFWDGFSKLAFSSVMMRGMAKQPTAKPNIMKNIVGAFSKTKDEAVKKTAPLAKKVTGQ